MSHAAALARPGIYEFACRARQVDAAGALTGAEVERRLRLVTDSEEARVLARVGAAVPAIGGTRGAHESTDWGSVLLEPA